MQRKKAVLKITNLISIQRDGNLIVNYDSFITKTIWYIYICVDVDKWTHIARIASFNSIDNWSLPMHFCMLCEKCNWFQGKIDAKLDILDLFQSTFLLDMWLLYGCAAIPLCLTLFNALKFKFFSNSQWIKENLCMKLVSMYMYGEPHFLHKLTGWVTLIRRKIPNLDYSWHHFQTVDNHIPINHIQILVFASTNFPQQ